MICISLIILSHILNKQACKYDNILLMGYFNLIVENKKLKVFMSTFDLECLIKESTCFQSPHPNCIGIILTNKK